MRLVAAQNNGRAVHQLNLLLRVAPPKRPSIGFAATRCLPRWVSLVVKPGPKSGEQIKFGATLLFQARRSTFRNFSPVEEKYGENGTALCCRSSGARACDSSAATHHPPVQYGRTIGATVDSSRAARLVAQVSGGRRAWSLSIRQARKQLAAFGCQAGAGPVGGRAGELYANWRAK